VSTRKLLPAIGLGAVAAGSVGAMVPGTAGAAGDTPHERVIDLASVSPANGALEPCSAYFGFGKVDMVTFDVELDSGEATGPLPTVGDGIEVVLVMSRQTGGELRCVPVEVTEEVWNSFWASVLSFGLSPPSFPGSGRYFFPAVNLDPEIDGHVVTNVAFEVTNVPDPYSLVSPISAQALPAVVTVDDLDGLSATVGTLTSGFSAYIEMQVDSAAAAALDAALAACAASEEPVSSTDLDAAWGAVLAFVPPDATDVPVEFVCDPGVILVALLTPRVEALAAAGQVATITIAAPGEPESSTSTVSPSTSSTPSPTTPVEPVDSVVTDILPTTGEQAGLRAAMAGALVVLGSALVALTRRRLRV
jgi:hypothetical protein